MTHAELYEIVKDHPDVWGEHLFPEIHKAHGVIWWANRAMGGTPVPAALVEPTLLGLGVAWLVENDKGLMILPKDNSGNYRVSAWSAACDSTPMLAAVYAAIGEVKAARRGSA